MLSARITVRSSPRLINRPLKPRNLFTVPSKGPRLDSAETINSTSVFLKWQPVPLDSRNGIIIRYTIHFRDEEKSKDDSKIVTASAVNATVNGLRQKAEYSFWIVAATSKGDGPPSSTEKTETKGKECNKFIGMPIRVFQTDSCSSSLPTLSSTRNFPEMMFYRMLKTTTLLGARFTDRIIIWKRWV